MKVFSIDPPNVGVFCLDGDLDIKVFDFDAGANDELDIKLFIEGPPGPAGPSGTSGALATVTTSGIIPLGRLFTRANPSGNISLTLPLASTVFVGGMTTVYTIKNLSTHRVTLLPSGSDTIEFDISAVMRFQYESLSLYASVGGWEII